MINASREGILEVESEDQHMACQAVSTKTS